MISTKVVVQVIAFDPFNDRAIGPPQPACETRRQHFQRCGYQDGLNVCIASAHGRNDCPRYIGDDDATGADGDVDRTWYSILVAVRLPPQCKLAVLNGAIEIGDVEAVVVLRIRDRSRDDAAWERDVRSVGTRSSRACNQGVLACAAWTDDQHETPRANEICWGCRRRGQSCHATRFPPHHTLRTAAASTA